MKPGDDQTHNVVSYSDTLEPQKVIAEKHEPSPKKSNVLKFNPDGSLCIPAELKDKINQQNPKPIKSVKTGLRRRFTGPKSKRPVEACSENGNEATSSSVTPLAPNPATISPVDPGNDDIEIIAERDDPSAKSDACELSQIDRKGKRKKSYTQLPGKTGFAAKAKEGYCQFCFTNAEGKDVGELKTCGDITAHYKCLLFASGLMQHGSNDDDFWGFMAPDVRKELNRGKRLKCTYCKQSGALVGCHKARCPCSYHLTCGMSNGCLMQYYDSFRSYCSQHRPLQYFALEMIGLTLDCPVCREELQVRDKIVPNDILVTECCNMTPIHRQCIQAQADASGYFFRCPMCNNEKKYNSIMKIMGVNIPQRDAAWEKDGYYDDLLEEYWRCDVPICLCEEGRSHDSRKRDQWDLLKCNTCGQSGAHPACLGYDKKGPKAWQCRNCIEILAKVEEDRKLAEAAKEKEEQRLKDEKKEELIQSFGFETVCSSRDPAPHCNVPEASQDPVETTNQTTAEPANESTVELLTAPSSTKSTAASSSAAKGTEKREGKKKQRQSEKKPLPPDRDPFLMTPRKLKEAVYQLCVAKLKADRVVAKDIDVDAWTNGLPDDELSEEEPEHVQHLHLQTPHLQPRLVNLVLVKMTIPTVEVKLEEEEAKLPVEEKKLSIFQQYSNGVKERKWSKAVKMYANKEEGDVTRIKYSGPSSRQHDLLDDERSDEGVELIWNPQPSSKILSTKNISFLIKQHGTKEEELKITKVENSVTAETLDKMTTTFYRISEEFEMDPTLMGLIEAKTGSIRSQTNIDRPTLEGILTFVKTRVPAGDSAGEGVVVSPDQTREIFEMISKILAGEKSDVNEVNRSNHELLGHLLTGPDTTPDTKEEPHTPADGAIDTKEEPSSSTSANADTTTSADVPAIEAPSSSNLENIELDTAESSKPSEEKKKKKTKRKLKFDAAQDIPKKKKRRKNVIKID